MSFETRSSRLFQIKSIFGYKALALAVPLLVACAPTKQLCPADYSVDFAEALHYATLSELAYAADTAIQTACGHDSCFIFTGATTKARAFVQVNDSAKTQWIAFRGTQTFSDFKLDADYTQLEDSVLHIHLHKGFAAATKDLYPMILPHLRAGYKTHVTGHSLGGAIAAISGLYLQAAGFTVDVETFGQPKVTNEAGAKKCASLNLVRFLNGQDLVTQVPPLNYRPGADLGSYEHFGREVALLGDGKGYECLTEHYRKRYDPEAWWAQVQEEALKDHGIALYLEKLKALAPKGDVAVGEGK
jgi:triacylglycerol lipase